MLPLFLRVKMEKYTKKTDTNVEARDSRQKKKKAPNFFLSVLIVLFRLQNQKKDVNRDSHIASSPILQSSFFKGVRCLILASSQRKFRGYIEFL